MKKFDSKRPLSWSSISQFEYNKSEWYRKYVLGERDDPSVEMTFGKTTGERLASDPKFLPHVPRYSRFEYELRTNLGSIPLVGYIDTYEPHTALREYKTGKKVWDQKRADTHRQIDMYLLMLYLMHKIPPEQITIHIDWLPTQDGFESMESFTSGNSEIGFVNDKDVVSFKTKRTMRDILLFAKHLKKTHKEMIGYACIK